MVFQFEVISLDKQQGKRKWNLAPLDFIAFKKAFEKWQVELKDEGWNSLFRNNHDLPRMVSRWGNDKEYRIEYAKMLATMLYMQKGTPYIYQGEEIRMTNVESQSIEDYNDIESLNMYKERISQGYNEKDVMESIYAKGRDNARMLMQWDNSKNAGLTEGNPWLKANENYKEINVAKDLSKEESIFKYYQKLINLRKSEDIIKYGDFKLLLEDHKEAFIYIRILNDEKLVVICNFYENNIAIELPEEFEYIHAEVLISNYGYDKDLSGNVILKPYEVVVFKISNK